MTVILGIRAETRPMCEQLLRKEFCCTLLYGVQWMRQAMRGLGNSTKLTLQKSSIMAATWLVMRP